VSLAILAKQSGEEFAPNFESLFYAGDAAAMASFYADDAKLMAEGTQPVGGAGRNRALLAGRLRRGRAGKGQAHHHGSPSRSLGRSRLQGWAR